MLVSLARRDATASDKHGGSEKPLQRIAKKIKVFDQNLMKTIHSIDKHPYGGIVGPYGWCPSGFRVARAIQNDVHMLFIYPLIYVSPFLKNVGFTTNSDGFVCICWCFIISNEVSCFAHIAIAWNTSSTSYLMLNKEHVHDKQIYNVICM